MAQVPSNLIPIKVTQLPLAPVADENSLMMIVYQGQNYQIRVGDLLQVAGVPITRQVIAGTGLQGGGQLNANVTLSIAPGGVGSAELASSGVTPGVYGTATNIPVFTVDSTGRVVAATTIPAQITGYVPTTRQVVAGQGLTGGGELTSDVTLNVNFSDSVPLVLDDTGSAGTSNQLSRADHQHPAVDLSDQQQVNGVLPMDQGGTSRSLVPNSGGIVWSGADGLYIGPPGAYGQVLASDGANQYIWATVDIDVPRPANTVRAGPVSGPDDLPTFRYLVNDDIPDTLDGKILTNVDINSGTIDGVVIGASAPNTGSFSQLTVDNVRIDGNTISTLNVNGDLSLLPDGIGKVVINTVDINGGNIDTTVIGNNNPAAGTFTTLTATTVNSTDVNATNMDTLNIDVTNLRAKDGTAAGSIADTTGVFTINSAVLTTADINGGTIDGVTIGGASPAAGTFTTVSATDVNATTVDTTNIEVTNLKAKDGTAAGSIANITGVVTLNSSVLTTADINGGTIDNTTIGATTPAAGTFTSVDTEYVDFATTLSPLPANATGRLYYDNNDQFKTLAFQMNGSTVQHIGEEQYFRVKCQGAITKGQVVMFAGTLGSSGGLIGAAATGLTPEQANYILGIADESGINNDWISVSNFGEVKGINTTGGAENWIQGQVLYYNPLVTGGLTKTKPNTPNAIAVIAAVVNVSASNGTLFVRPTFGSVLGGTDGNVQFGTLSNNDMIVYDSADQRWENVAASSISVGSATTATNVAGGAAGSIPYQTGAGVTAMLAAGSGVLIGGTTPAYSTAPSLTGTNFTSIPNAALTNSAVTIGTTSIALGASSLTLSGLTSVAVTQDPSTALQLATKQYVDGLVASGITYHSPVKYEVPNTTGNLTAIYNNGTAGVGATLTNNGALGAFTPDGVVAQVNDRVLIYNQTNQFENGVYTVTTVGDGSTAWVLTRATDADSYGLKSVSKLGEGDAFFVTSGNTGAGETYVCNTSGIITFGTTAITFTQVSSSQVYSAGTGLTLTNTQFSLTVPVTANTGGTGQTSYTTGDILYASGTAALSRLNIGASSRILTSTGSAPQWSDPSGITVGSATTATSATSATTATTATNLAGGSAGTLPYQSAAGTTAMLAAGTADYVLKANGAAAPTWVAQSTLSVGSATSATSATAASNIAGGTAGALPYNTGTNATSFLSLGTQNYVLTAGATSPQYVAQSTLSVGSASTATTATNVAGGAANKVVYNTGAGATSFIDAPTLSNTYLKWNGSAFAWDSIAGAGTVTSVDMTVPTGLSVSGVPITTSGTIALTFASGYSIPTTASQTNWDTAYTDRLKWDGGATGLNAATGRTSLGASTLGSNLFTITNPSAITFPRFNADNSVSALTASDFRTAIGAGTGTVTSVGGTGTVNGITLTGTVTSSGSLTLGGTLSGVDLTTQVTGTLPIASGGTNTTSTPTAGGAVYGTGTAYAFTAAGTAGQVLTSNGAGAPTWSGISGGTF